MVRLAEEKKQETRQTVNLLRIEFKRLLSRNQEMPPYLQLPQTVCKVLTYLNESECHKVHSCVYFFIAMIFSIYPSKKKLTDFVNRLFPLLPNIDFLAPRPPFCVFQIMN